MRWNAYFATHCPTVTHVMWLLSILSFFKIINSVDVYMSMSDKVYVLHSRRQRDIEQIKI